MRYFIQMINKRSPSEFTDPTLKSQASSQWSRVNFEYWRSSLYNDKIDQQGCLKIISSLTVEFYAFDYNLKLEKFLR